MRKIKMHASFRYAAEKLGAARRGLMLPHPKGEAESIAYAFHECLLGLKDIPRDDLDAGARSWVTSIERLMDTEGISDPSERGTWKLKAESLTVDEKTELSRSVDELAEWFDRMFKDSH